MDCRKLIVIDEGLEGKVSELSADRTWFRLHAKESDKNEYTEDK